MSSIQDLLDLQKSQSHAIESIATFLSTASGHHKLILQSGPECYLMLDGPENPIREFILKQLQEDLADVREEAEVTAKKLTAAVESL